jgi:hypothetical protein
MYHDNFRFFLEQGLPCSHHSSTYSSEKGKVAVVTVAIVLTNETFMAYKTLLAAANAKCGGVEMIIRKNRCYDLESVRVALTPRRIAAHRTFVYVNCGLIGPLLPYLSPEGLAQNWPLIFVNALNVRVKMTGLTVNCQTKLTKRMGERLPHVQSFLWAAATQQGDSAEFAPCLCAVSLRPVVSRAHVLVDEVARVEEVAERRHRVIAPITPGSRLKSTARGIKSPSEASW